MNGFVWIIVLVPVVVGGIYLLRRRSGTANPYVSIYQNPGDIARRNSVDDRTYRTYEDSEAQESNRHGGCCSR